MFTAAPLRFGAEAKLSIVGGRRDCDPATKAAATAASGVGVKAKSNTAATP